MKGASPKKFHVLIFKLRLPINSPKKISLFFKCPFNPSKRSTLPSYRGERQSLAQLYGVVIILVDGARLSGLPVGQLTRLSNAEGCPLEFLNCGIRGVLFFLHCIVIFLYLP